MPSAGNDGGAMASVMQQDPPVYRRQGFRGIDPVADYLVRFAHSYDPSVPVRMRGCELKAQVLEIGQCPGPVLVEYRRARS